MAEKVPDCIITCKYKGPYPPSHSQYKVFIAYIGYYRIYLGTNSDKIGLAGLGPCCLLMV